MYTDDLISRQELNDKIGGFRKEIEHLENELKKVSYHLTKEEQIESVLNHTFNEIEDITDVREMTNTQLKPASVLSGGEQIKLAFAGLLVSRMNLLILDGKLMPVNRKD